MCPASKYTSIGLQKTEAIQTYFLYYNGMKLKVSNRRNLGLFINMLRLSNTFPVIQWVKKEFRKDVRK